MISRWFSVLCPEKRQNRMQAGLFLPRSQFCPPHWPGKMHQAIFHASLPVLPASFGPVECIRPFSCLPHVKRKTTSQRSRLPPFSQRKSSDTRLFPGEMPRTERLHKIACILSPIKCVGLQHRPQNFPGYVRMASHGGQAARLSNEKK